MQTVLRMLLIPALRETEVAGAPPTQLMADGEKP